MSRLHLFSSFTARALVLATLLVGGRSVCASDRVLWRNQADGSVSIWLMDGPQRLSGGLVTRDGQPLKVVDPGWKIAAWADFDGNGERDILWRFPALGTNAIWFVSGNTITSSGLINPIGDTNWVIVGAADFDNDGKADILWRNSVTGQNSIWKMVGSTLVSGTEITQLPDQNWQVAALADFDGDGKADIFWHHRLTGQNVIWGMDLDKVATVTGVTSVSDPNWTIVQAGDFNGDGKADLLWRHKTTGEVSIWIWDGVTMHGALLPTVADQSWQVVGVRDFDGDGKTDLLWRNLNSGDNSMWLIDGTITKSRGLIMAVPDPKWDASAGMVSRALPTGNPPLLPTPPVQGNWHLDLKPSAGAASPMVGAMVENAGGITGTFHIVDSCLDPATNAHLAGAIMTDRLLLKGSVGTTNVDLAATLNANGSIGNAKYSLSGGCVSAVTGTATGLRLEPLTTFGQGSATSSAGKVSYSSGQVIFVQGNAGPDGYSPVGGTSSVGTGGGCGIGGTIDPAQSFIAGKFLHLEIKDGAALHVIEGTFGPAMVSFTGEFSTYGGTICDGDFGTVSLSK